MPLIRPPAFVSGSLRRAPISSFLFVLALLPLLPLVAGTGSVPPGTPSPAPPTTASPETDLYGRA
ncbi:MAG: hypothetical protein MI919_22520, partial [Holophagales bacterium]|nr:hypothetical protein [Holophagales bacterium]